MSKCCCLITYVVITAYCTSVGGVAAVFAIGCSHYRVVVMSGCDHFDLRNGNCITYCTLLAIGKTVFGTGRCKSVECLFLMTLSYDICLMYEHVITGRALLARSETVLGTGRSLCLKVNLGVTECIGVIGNVTVSAYSTLMIGISGLSTGGRSHGFGIAVRLGAVGNCKIIGRIIGILDSGVVLYLNGLPVGREVKHSNHTLGAVVIFSIHALGVDKDGGNLVAVVACLLGYKNTVGIGMSANNHRDIRMLTEELIPQAVSGIVIRIVSGSISALPGFRKCTVAL